MNDSLQLRGASAADIPTIVRHRRLMFESMGFCDRTQNDEMDAATADYLAEAVPSGAYRGWMVATPEGRVVAGGGLAVIRLPGKPLNPSGRFSYLMSLYVEPEYRRQGIARGLMAEMIQWSREQGITEIRLHASDEGHPLYERMGFHDTNEMRLLLENSE